MTAEVLSVLRSYLKTGESGRTIANALSLDKKTVSLYAKRIVGLNLPDDLDYLELLRRLSGLISENRKPTPSQVPLAPYADEIRMLIAGNKETHQEPMKAKTAWEVVSRRHDLAESTSYETFKRFVRAKGLVRPPQTPVPRIETEPGEEVQIDYGKVGMRDVGTRRRVVNAFCGILAASRLPFISFVLSQDEVSFSHSVADMFSFYGGVTRRINLDNLKSGVLQPDIYDPALNRTFGELCDYYDVIADPARVASPKDKGNAE
jgi:transposase